MKAEIGRRLGEEFNLRFKTILQAINSFAHKGVTETEQALEEKRAILLHVKKEMEIIDGIELVYRALL